VGFSPDGTRLAVLRPRELVLLDAQSGAEIWRRPADWAKVDVAWSPDGLRLAATEASRGDIFVLDAASGQIEQLLPGEAVPPRLLAFGPGPRRLTTISDGATLRVWDIPNRDTVFQTELAPRVLAFSPDGQSMMSGRGWLEVGVFAWEPESVFRELFAGKVTRLGCDDLTFSPDGRWVATSDSREVRIWSSREGRQVAAFDVPDADWSSVRFHSDGKSILSSSMNRGVSRRTFAPAADGEVPRLGPEEPIGRHRDGRLLGLSTDGNWYIDRESITQVVVWPGGDPAKERPVAESAHWDRPQVSPDGKFVATMGYPRPNVRVTAVGNGHPPVVLPVQNHAGANFSPDGRWLATGTEAGFQFWTLPDLRPGPLVTQPVPGSQWRTPVFSPDGTRMAFELQHGEVEIRRTSDLEVIGVLIPPVRIDISFVAWSPDAQSLFLLGYGHRLFEWRLDEVRKNLQARGLER
jgi:WD40 repeat protein